MTKALSIKKIAISVTFLAILFLSLAVFFPIPTHATCDFHGITCVCMGPQGEGDCSFEDLVAAALKLVNWGTIFALEFSVIVLAYAGFKYMTSDGNPGKRSEATGMLLKVVIGIVIIVAAWLIVNVIVTTLGVNTGGINFR
jgi:uncharacterized membrane protein